MSNFPLEPDKIHAPFTDEQVACINRYQSLGGVHEMTSLLGNTLVAYPDALRSSVAGDDYVQYWVPAFMCNQEWLDNQEAFIKGISDLVPDAE